MDKEYEQLSVEFTTKAQKLFIFAYENFRDSTRKLDRQKDENVFQLQIGKFLATLKLQLEQTAQELLQKNRAIKNIEQGRQVLKDKIGLYLAEFKLKATSI